MWVYFGDQLMDNKRKIYKGKQGKGVFSNILPKHGGTFLKTKSSQRVHQRRERHGPSGAEGRLMWPSV